MFLILCVECNRQDAVGTTPQGNALDAFGGITIYSTRVVTREDSDQARTVPLGVNRARPLDVRHGSLQLREEQGCAVPLHPPKRTQEPERLAYCPPRTGHT